MNIGWMMFKVEWKSKSAKTKRLLLDLLKNDSHYRHVEYLDPHSVYWFKGRIHAEYRYTGERVQILFHPQLGYIIDFAAKKKYVQDYSCVPAVDAMRLYREIQLMSLEFEEEKAAKCKERKKNEQ